MDIKHLQYFIEIVNCNFNLSLASKKLMVSQPALSQVIRSFELNENLQLFERYHRRLQGLTPSGKILYKHALVLTENYNHMLEDLRKSSASIKGKIKIGIPPLVLGTVFSKIIPTMIMENPDINFEIIEAGAFELRRDLSTKKLDLAILLFSPEYESSDMNEYFLIENELTAFMSKSNHLAVKEKLNWSDLHNQTLAIFDNSFMIYHKLMEKFQKEGINPKISIMSANWDYLMMCVKKTDFITILPSSVKNIFWLDGISELRFNQPIPWRVTACQLKKPRYNEIEKYVLKTLRSHF